MTSELGRRLWFTIGALLVYRLGSHIPLPGIDPSAWDQIFRSQAGGILGMFNVFSGGGIHRLAIFALGLLPYLSAAILIQLISFFPTTLRTLARQGEYGRRTLELYTRYLAVLLAAFQAYGIAVGLERVDNLVGAPGWLFRASTVLSLTGGTMFLVWLSGQITLRGIGNGLAMIFALGIIVELPAAAVGMLELGRHGVLSTGGILGLIAFVADLTGLIVFGELARRRFLVVYSRRQVGMRMIEGQSYLAVKLNPAGMLPAVFASSLLLLPITIINTFHTGRSPDWLAAIVTQLSHGRPLFLLYYALAIVLCVFVYTAFVLSPDQLAADIARHGGAIPGVAPGNATAAHLDAAISRTTILGATYLALVYLVPELLISYVAVPFYFGGTSLLLVVGAAVDLNAQLKNHALVMGGDQRP